MDSLILKKKRRSKKDIEGRTFACECGKSYLSYQALYTHKHKKHIENDTTSLPKKRRGRPRGLKSILSNYDPSFPFKNTPLFDKLLSPSESIKKSSCDDIFAEFLQEKSKTLSKKEYKSLATSILNLRECINKYSSEMSDSKLPPENSEYTSLRTAEFLPQMSNTYVLKYLPLNKVEFNREYEVKFILDFCAWLTSKNYTDLEVSIIS